MTRRRRRAVALTAALALIVAGCGDDDADGTADDTATTSASTSAPSPTASAPELDGTIALDEVAVTLVEIADLAQPLDLTFRPGTPGLFVAEKGGRVQHVAAPGAEPQLALDISGDVSGGNEQGLLGIAFSPDGSMLYAHYTNRDGDTRVDEWAMGPRPADVDTASRRTVFGTRQPFPNHNGGRLTFGPDGLLYLGLGDGGAAGDPQDNAENPDSPLGKILRFDPAAGGEPERWAIGLRNPWRFSFDRATGDVWVGDVGQNQWEEIDLIPAGTPAGVDLGWDRFEGTHEFEGGDRDGLLFPVFEYGRDEGQSVVGGFVYRGGHEAWHGIYFFADTYTASLRVLRAGADGIEHRDLGVGVPGGLVASFGEDADGELYVLSLGGGVFRVEPA
ncbi:MAG TPA: PQQ-dependent sugar dehydrogenase [Acidimicrobiales bacterium]|nr:PQQ-dependent sugar dehydrogenase [Acidimicrobiales bacterium]